MVVRILAFTARGRRGLVQPAFALYERAESALPTICALYLRSSGPGLITLLAAAAVRLWYT